MFRRLWLGGLLLVGLQAHADQTIVTVNTVVGSFELLMRDDSAPQTVQNFLNYVEDGDYNGTFIHRSVPGFVIQGGGYVFQSPDFVLSIPRDTPVVNEFGISNTRGTVAMAKLGGDPNSATSEWFVNLANNAANLDNQNGGFTVFAEVIGDGMEVVDQIAALDTYRLNVRNANGQIFTLEDTPTVNVQGFISPDIFIYIESMTVTVLPDTDGDGLLDRDDPDDDNDSTPDVSDAFPFDPTEQTDTDGDGIGNNADTDDDNDGVPDVDDAFPLDPSESLDTDFDLIGNNADTDDDGDSVLDEFDAFPLDPLESVDTDGDGIGNKADPDDDNDGVADAADAFPLDPSESGDFDGDGIGNTADDDDDNDGIVDAEDAFPYDATNTPLGTDNRLENLATRGYIGTGDDVLIGGLVIRGTEPKTVAIRARGPSLADAGVPDPLADPQVRLFQGGTSIDFNDNWQDHPGADQIPESIRPGNALDAAIAVTLAPGNYTAIVDGVGGSLGVGIVEIFEVSATGETRLQNIATRGFVGTGDNVMIAGVIIAGTEPKAVVIRAKGPSLEGQGVPNSLANPELRIFSGATSIEYNDNWQAHQNNVLIPVDLKPTDANEAAIYTVLPPGAYTAIVSGVGNTSGVGLVEVFEILAD
ncbi:MAG: peptidylprolyl isomerase [Pseudomonadota bacterium]